MTIAHNEMQYLLFSIFHLYLNIKILKILLSYNIPVLKYNVVNPVSA